MEDNEDVLGEAWKVLNQEDHKKLSKAVELFLNSDDYIHKDTESYLVFLQKNDPGLYEKLINSEEPIIENLKNKNPSGGISPGFLEIITDALERSESFYGKGGRLTKEKIYLYYKVFYRYDTEKQKSEKPKWSEVFRSVSLGKDEDDPLISDEEDRETQYKSFLKFREQNKLNSLNNFITFLQQKDYPSNFFINIEKK